MNNTEDDQSFGITNVKIVSLKIVELADRLIFGDSLEQEYAYFEQFTGDVDDSELS